MTEEGVLFPAQPERCYGWLMQLRDGNRLDLHVCTPAYALGNLELYRTLLDKDGLMPGAAECRSFLERVRELPRNAQSIF